MPSVSGANSEPLGPRRVFPPSASSSQLDTIKAEVVETSMRSSSSDRQSSKPRDRDRERDSGSRKRSRSRDRRNRSRSRSRHDRGDRKRSRSRDRRRRRSDSRDRRSRDKDSSAASLPIKQEPVEAAASVQQLPPLQQAQLFLQQQQLAQGFPGFAQGGFNFNPNAAGSGNGSFQFQSQQQADIDGQELSGGQRKRKSRWAAAEERAFVPGMPTMIPSNLSEEQKTAYLLQLQIEEISRKLRSGDLGIPPNPEDRSPSPEPLYDNKGQRLNTREYRTKKKLEEQRHELIQQMFKVNSLYKPPPDYKPPLVRINERVWIPQDEHPEINFVGLLIGPRGNTLKALEKETGAKIIIRGKGSVKEGKVGRKDGGPMPGEDEPLHAYLTATSMECIKRASDRIKQIIAEGLDVPEQQNELRKNQLRELALLNGTLRADDLLALRCGNCGANTHKTWECPEKQNVTHGIICTICGGAGHISKDCKSRPPGSNLRDYANVVGPGQDRAALDDEYSALMAELGEDAPASGYGRHQLNKRAGSSSLFSTGPMGAITAGSGGTSGEGGDGERPSFQPRGPRPLPQPMFTVNLAEQFKDQLNNPQPLFRHARPRFNRNKDYHNSRDGGSYGRGIPRPPAPPFPGMMGFMPMQMGFPNPMSSPFSLFPGPVPPPPPATGSEDATSSATTETTAADSDVKLSSSGIDSIFGMVPPPPPPMS